MPSKKSASGKKSRKKTKAQSATVAAAVEVVAGDPAVPPPPGPLPVQKEPAALVRVMPHLSPDEHVARGKAARAETARRDHAGWEPPSLRTDPIALLEAQATTRVPELLPIRYGRMMASPFAFYRGAAAIMAADLATTPRSGLLAQLCGDAHLANFGVFAAPDRALVFDINDFDETLPGPWEWDVKRLAASIEVAGRQRGFEPGARREAVVSGVRSYRDAMTDFSQRNNLDVWYARLDTDEILAKLRELTAAKGGKLLRQAAANTERSIEKARGKDSLKAFGKLTTVVDGKVRIVDDPPLIVSLESLLKPEQVQLMSESLHGIFRSYRATLPEDRRRLLERYRVVDIARKVVGVGSVGTRAWIALVLGRDDNDPLFLQFKEAQPSVLETFVGKSRYSNHGRRVVEGQRLVQAASDIMLGWTRVSGIDGKQRDFYVRQLWDGKGSANLEVIQPTGLAVYARICGWTLARAHARSGDRIAIAAYMGNGDVFPEAVADFSSAYAEQNERDHQELVAAVKSGRLPAETGI